MKSSGSRCIASSVSSRGTEAKVPSKEEKAFRRLLGVRSRARAFSGRPRTALAGFSPRPHTSSPGGPHGPPASEAAERRGAVGTRAALFAAWAATRSDREGGGSGKGSRRPDRKRGHQVDLDHLGEPTEMIPVLRPFARAACAWPSWVARIRPQTRYTQSVGTLGIAAHRMSRMDPVIGSRRGGPATIRKFRTVQPSGFGGQLRSRTLRKFRKVGGMGS